jgi:hypothetical protein
MTLLVRNRQPWKALESARILIHNTVFECFVLHTVDRTHNKKHSSAFLLFIKVEHSYLYSLESLLIELL